VPDYEQAVGATDTLTILPGFVKAVPVKDGFVPDSGLVGRRWLAVRRDQRPPAAGIFRRRKISRYRSKQTT
jgi:hypothetical protein